MFYPDSRAGQGQAAVSQELVYPPIIILVTIFSHVLTRLTLMFELIGWSSIQMMIAKLRLVKCKHYTATYRVDIRWNCKLLSLCSNVTKIDSCIFIVAGELSVPDYHEWFWCEAYCTYQQFGEVGGLDVVIVDDWGDGGHEGQACWHVQVQVEGLAEPADGRSERRRKALKQYEINW